ncbi:hypothetical protein MSG28_005066 [Choristoneura fumiferana]|uniref:Uncharacterized protein n=1 Tax=Choristoneura fumiferana TaxID=7141 RepID=A0ACC0JPY4_CHOFU|nr:hypothetical protein MSG28_005066 [Choristoneura fumiferana]
MAVLNYNWDDTISKLSQESLLRESCTAGRARLLAAGTREACYWLHALPSRNMGTQYPATVGMPTPRGPGLRPTSVSLRKRRGPAWHHGLSCQRSAGRFSRHAALNDIIRRALATVNVPAILEPTGISRNDGRRSVGRPPSRWTNDIVKVAGNRWMQVASCSAVDVFHLAAFKFFLKKEIPGVYVNSLRIGNSTIEDFESGYFMNPNKQIDYVCKELAADPELQNGFNAIGFSQGSQFLGVKRPPRPPVPGVFQMSMNSLDQVLDMAKICLIFSSTFKTRWNSFSFATMGSERGVIERCGHKLPPVKNFISLGGQHQGVYGIPHCMALASETCDYIRELLNYAAYHRQATETGDRDWRSRPSLNVRNLASLSPVSDSLANYLFIY